MKTTENGMTLTSWAFIIALNVLIILPAAFILISALKSVTLGGVFVVAGVVVWVSVLVLNAKCSKNSARTRMN